MSAWVALPDCYKIDEVVRLGKYSTLLRAKDRRSRNTVAVKIIHPLGWLSEDESAARLRRMDGAMRRMACLHHPNITQIYEAGAFQGAFYVARDWLEEDSLRSILAKHGALPLEKVLHIAVQTADALDSLSHAGLKHGGLHAGNLFVAVDGTVRITETALNEAAWQFALTGCSCRLSAPLVPVDDRTSLAAIVYQALTGLELSPCGSGFRDCNLPGIVRRTLDRALSGRKTRNSSAQTFGASLLPAPSPDLFRLAWRPAAAIGLFLSLSTIGGNGFTDLRDRPSKRPVVLTGSRTASVIGPALSEDDRLALRLEARRSGVSSLAEPSIGDLFRLSEQQRALIADCLAEQRARVEAIVNAAAEGSVVDTGAAMRSVRDATTAHVLMLLDDAQRARWQRIVDTPPAPDEPAI